MSRPSYFYYGTIKNLIAAFGIIFKDVVFVNDFGQSIKVPIYYAPREKFMQFITERKDTDRELDIDIVLPRFGFEMISIDYDSTRMLNPLSRMMDTDDAQKKYMLNRVPYNVSFTLYLGTSRFEDSLKIIEQIVPFFTPELNISIKDKEDFGISTDIPISMTNMSFMIDYQGSFETRRTILWQLDFVMKAFLYSNVREQYRIKETIVNMTTEDFGKVYESLTSIVEPRTAEKNDPHIIVDKVYDGSVPKKLSFDFVTGEVLSPNPPEIDDSFTIFSLHPISVGSTIKVVPFQNSL